MQEKFRGCLMGVALGDALGMPVEMMSRSEILKLNEGKGIVDFVGPIQDKISDARNLKACSTTDDWQLTEVVAQSLIYCRGFNLWDQALRHVAALEAGIFGWGRTTRENIQEIKLFFDSRGKTGRSPQNTLRDLEGAGGGNGVAMKIAPLALAAAAQNREGRGDITMLAGLTHSKSFAVSAGMILGHLIFLHAGNFEIISSSNPINQATPKEILDELLNSFIDLTDTTIAKLRSLHGNFNKILSEPIDYCVDLLGNGCLASESVPLAIAISLRNPYDFQAGLLEAANAGGDTDTISSMVGAILGSKLGLASVPETWRSKPEFQKTINVADQLWEAFREKESERGNEESSHCGSEN